MSESYYAGAYWGARKELVGECARRMELLLSILAQVDPSFAQWFQRGKSRRDALKRPIHANRDALEVLLRKGQDAGFEDLGFRLSGWNGAEHDDDTVGFRVKCGGYSGQLSNTCVFTLPERGIVAGRILSAPVLAGLVRSMAIAMDPDWAIATSSDHRDAVTTVPEIGTFVGWMMYFSAGRGRVPPLPPPVRVESIEDRGTLVVLTPERFSATNPGHLELAARVHEQLTLAGLLGPVQLA